MALQSDSHLEIVPLMDEDPHSYVMSYALDRMNQFIAGSLDMPESRQREVFHLRGISNLSSSLRFMLDGYFSGGQVRAYRLYPSNLTEWTVDNTHGYSDMVHPNPSGSTYPWYSKMEVWEFTLDGVNLSVPEEDSEYTPPSLEG